MNINNAVFSRIVQGVVFLTCAVAFIMPHRLWVWLGSLLGRLLYHTLKKHRQYALTNINFALGSELSPEKQQEIIKKSFTLLGMSVFEALRCPGFVVSGLERNSKNISFEGMEHFEQAKATGKGILLLNGHFGMTELANLYYVRQTGRKLNFILRRFDNQHLQKVILAHNKKFGINHLYKQNGLRPAMKNLMKGEDLIIFPDQSSNLKEGVNSTLFNRPSVTLSIMPAIAMKVGCPILPMFIFRQDDPIKHKIVFFPPIIPGEDDTIETLTQKQNDAIERAVRMKPEQWLWLHRRWKQDNPALYKK